MSAPGPWRVVSLDLSRGVPALRAEPGVRGLYVVYWWRDLPLGQEAIPEADLPLTAIQVRERASEAITPAVGDRLFKHGFKAPLPERSDGPAAPPDFHALMALDRPLHALQERQRDRAAGAENAEAAPALSVVICTRDRATSLARCLRSIKALRQPPEEVVVVDNAPATDAARRLVAKWPDVRYVLEPRPGLSAARNAGIRASTGDLIAFTDDDLVLHPDWAARLRDAFADPGVAAMTGLVLPAELETPAQLAFETRWSFNRGFRRRLFDAAFFQETQRWGAPVWEIGAGANMAFRRTLFEEVGGFDERLGAGASGCSEDSEVWYRALAAGRACRYEPAAVAYHYHRRDAAGLRHQLYQYMRGHVAALLIQFAKHRHRGNLHRLFHILPRHYARLLLQRTWEGSASGPLALRAQWRGSAAGLLFYLKHRRAPGAPTIPPRNPPPPG